MSGSEWLRFQHELMTVFLFVSVLLNSFLVFLIQRKSPKNLGPYKYLMKFISVFEIFYSIMDYLVLPVMHSHGSSFFIMTPIEDTMFNKPTALVLQGVWCGFFGASMAIFGIHFVYRYLAVTGSRYINTFGGFKVLLWLLIPIVYGLIWGIIAYLCCGPKEVLAEYIRENLMESFELSVDDVVYIGPYFYAENGDFNLDRDVILTIIFAVLIMASSLFTIFYFGAKCYLALARIQSTTGHSLHFQTLQTQFFTALVLQTVIPIALMHLPLMVNYASALANHGLGKLSNLASITIALYPVIDPLPTLFIIKNYREAVKNFIFLPRKLFRCAVGKVLNTEVASRKVSEQPESWNDEMIL